MSQKVLAKQSFHLVHTSFKTNNYHNENYPSNQNSGIVLKPKIIES